MFFLRVRWADASGMKRMDNALGRLSAEEHGHVLRRAVNHTGEKARTQVTRTLATQTGLPYRTIRRAIVVKRANYSTLEYSMRVVGGDVSLKYFRPTETRAGVTATPFGKRRLFVGAFTKAGHFPKRVTVASLSGHVFEPDRSTRSWGRPIALKDSGVVIPRELHRGDTVKVFRGVVERDLPARVSHEIGFMLPGFFD